MRIKRLPVLYFLTFSLRYLYCYIFPIFLPQGLIAYKLETNRDLFRCVLTDDYLDYPIHVSLVTGVTLLARMAAFPFCRARLNLWKVCLVTSPNSRPWFLAIALATPLMASTASSRCCFSTWGERLPAPATLVKMSLTALCHPMRSAVQMQCMLYGEVYYLSVKGRRLLHHLTLTR